MACALSVPLRKGVRQTPDVPYDAAAVFSWTDATATAPQYHRMQSRVTLSRPAATVEQRPQQASELAVLGDRAGALR
jgi:hypothetical protein